MPHATNPQLEALDGLVGAWTTEATHPAVPGTLVRGRTTFGWLEGRRFLIQRSWTDHPDFPDGIAIIGVTDDRLRMHYFDSRGLDRVYDASMGDGVWRFWRDAPGFNQRFAGTLSADGATITGLVELSRDGATWKDDLRITYRRATSDLDAMARRVIDANHYMTLGTRDPDGRPRLSPVYYTAARYADFYWLSSPNAHHSQNLVERPEVEIVIFDSTAAVGKGEAVYLSARARAIRDDELDRVHGEAFRTTAGARRFEPDELRGDTSLQLYVAHASSCEVHVPGRDPVHGRGVDTRQPANPGAG